MFSLLLTIMIAILLLWFFYDRFVQRSHSLLINYPIIGRMRYFFEAVREPFRQYFGDEDVFDSRDKIEWVYKAARDKSTYISFSPSNPQKNPKFMLRHAFAPLNEDEVDKKELRISELLKLVNGKLLTNEEFQLLKEAILKENIKHLTVYTMPYPKSNIRGLAITVRYTITTLAVS